MEDVEKLLFIDILSSLKELNLLLKSSKKNESVKDLKFLYAKDVAKILHKSLEDTRKLMRSPTFPSVPDENGDLKVEEQAFIRWCRAENIEVRKEA